MFYAAVPPGLGSCQSSCIYPRSSRNPDFVFFVPPNPIHRYNHFKTLLIFGPCFKRTPPRVFCNVTPPPFFTFPKQFFRSVVVCRLTFINQSLILYLPISNPLFTDLQSFIYRYPILHLPISDPLFTDLQSFIYQSPILYLPISNPLFTDLQSFIYRSPILYLPISNPLFTDLQSFVYRSPILYLQISNPLFTDLQSLNS